LKCLQALTAALLNTIDSKLANNITSVMDTCFCTCHSLACHCSWWGSEHACKALIAKLHYMLILVSHH
jgi:hypothetical protein